jgi:MurNAc alpha-1-phosphate uridylyltransferase
VISGDIWSEFPLDSCIDRLAHADVAHFVLVPNPDFHAQGDFGIESGRLLDRAPRHTYANIGVLRPEFFGERQPGRFAAGAADVRLDPAGPRQRRAVSRRWSQSRYA